MNEAYEVELNQITASFIPSPFDLVIGVERQTTVKVDEQGACTGYLDVEWQVMYTRVLIDNRWFFLPQTMYDELDDMYGEQIGDCLWKLTSTLI